MNMVSMIATKKKIGRESEAEEGSDDCGDEEGADVEE